MQIWNLNNLVRNMLEIIDNIANKKVVLEGDFNLFLEGKL